MKNFWVKVIPWNKEIVITALESGADAVLIPEGFSSKVKELGLIKTVAEDGDIRLGEDAVLFTIKSKEDEEEAVRLSKSKTLILSTPNWRIIPLENLVAQTTSLVAEVKNTKEARTALQILEHGVDGVLLDTTDIGEIKRCGELIKESLLGVVLKTAKITRVEPLGMGDRVCVDTCTNMHRGEGMLVGNSSSAMFLVHSESVENPYVEARPFRVNAGAVHAYILLPGGKTKYLSELKSGDEALIVNSSGGSKPAVVGRVKVEKRPLMLVEGETEDVKVSLILQNAETIRLTRPDGEPVSVVELLHESEVLAYTETPGRHFGMKIEETITEK